MEEVDLERMKDYNRGVWEPKHKERERPCWVLGYYTILLKHHGWTFIMGALNFKFIGLVQFYEQLESFKIR